MDTACRSFSLSFNLSDLKDLNSFLESRSYVVGFRATAKDAELFTALGKAPDAKKFPNVARFYSHMSSYSAAALAALPAGFGGGAAPAKKEGGKPAAK